MTDTSAQVEPDIRRPTGSRMYPRGFWRECKALWKLSWPTSLSILFHYMIQPISLAFCGHLGTVELAATALALSVIYLAVVGIGRGLAFTGDTFFSQTYGGNNKKLMGVHLQRCVYLGVLTSLPLCAFLLNTEGFLRLIGQDPDVSRLAQQYVLYFIPGTLAYCWLFTIMRYLLCQNRVLPNLFICMVCAGINVLLNYCLVYQTDLGIIGSGIALMLTYYLVLVLLVLYLWCSGVYKETWAGWTWRSLEDWGPIGRLALFSIFLNLILWLATEMGTYLAGVLGEKELSSYSIMFQVEGFVWMIPLGLGGACAARVGQYLGANDPLGAMTCTRVAFTIQIFLSTIFGAASYVLRYQIPKAFTSNKELIEYTAGLMPWLSIYLFFEGIAGVGLGIVRGSGRQRLGSLIIFLSNYVGGLPIGICLTFLSPLKMTGLWIGYVLCLVFLDIGLLLFVACVNWQKEADLAQERAGVVKSDVSVNGSINKEPNENTVLLSGENKSLVTAEVTGRPPARVLLNRLLILLLFICTAVGGLMVRLYAPLPPVSKPFTPLCLPTSQTPLTNTTTLIPWCSSPANTTSF